MRPRPPTEQGEGHSRWRWPVAAAAVVAAGLVVSACGSRGAVVDPIVRPAVERLQSAPSPLRWSFSYQPDSASPYIACLTGIDSAAGVIDLEAGALTVQPDRDAPPIVITDSSFMVPSGTGSTDTWDEVRWSSEDDPALLLPVFGAVLTGYITTGMGEPDLNMTALAALDIATGVSAATPPAGITGDSFLITVDPDLYLAELTANRSAAADDAIDRIPTFTVTVDDIGRVIALVVDASTTPPGDQPAHRDRYFVTATYNIDAIELPATQRRRIVGLASITYPAARDSCLFNS